MMNEQEERELLEWAKDNVPDHYDTVMYVDRVIREAVEAHIGDHNRGKWEMSIFSRIRSSLQQRASLLSVLSTLRAYRVRP